MEWQIADAVREELEDKSSDMRLVREVEQSVESAHEVNNADDRVEEILSLEECQTIDSTSTSTFDDLCGSTLVLPWVKQSKMKARKTKGCVLDDGLPWVEQPKMKARQTKKCDADEWCELDDDDDRICRSTDDYYGGTTGPWLQQSREQMSESSPLGKTTATQLPNTHYPTRRPTNSTSNPIPL